MKVFLSWSGEQSRELAEVIRDWLPAVLQNVKPFFTPNDIEKGARWSKDIASELEQSSVGIFCLTKENLNKPWIMFEAGALSKKLDSSSVCPILFGIDNADVEGPLVQFQSSPFSEVEIKKLIKTINNNNLDDQKLEDSVVNSVFEMWWPKLNDKVTKIIDKYNKKPKDMSQGRSDRDILEEVLQLSRLNSQSVLSGNEKGSFDPSALSHAIRQIVILSKALYDESELIDSNYRRSIFSLLNEIVGPLHYMARRVPMGKYAPEFDENINKISAITGLELF